LWLEIPRVRAAYVDAGVEADDKGVACTAIEPGERYVAPEIVQAALDATQAFDGTLVDAEAVQLYDCHCRLSFR
jgi:hypothetical protein